MKKVLIIILSILLFWFSLDITGFKIGNFYLVESAIKNEFIDVIWWLILIMLFIIFLFKEKIGKYALVVFITIWCFMQYSMYFTKNIESYNNFFKETHHIILASDSFLIKDTYHIMLDLFLVITLICLIMFIFKTKKKVRTPR